MVKTYTPSEDSEVTCATCGVAFKSPNSPRGRRVSCPKCRESVLFENAAEPAPAKKGRAPAVPNPTAEAEPERSPGETLESRVAALEATVAALIVAGSATEHADERKKLQWATTTAADPLEAFSPERERALAHNLGTARAREITFRIPQGDSAAGERAASMMKLFELAGWTTRGPEAAAPGANRKSLVLGVPSLPVGKEAAETYLALKAAGFEPVPMLDQALASTDDVTSLSLTLPASNPAQSPA